ncbi:MAG: aldo/keto reductase, partial [Lentisphaerae bacterium]|nr:aldo/keto reductase [Lentisphaerota bacterium]
FYDEACKDQWFGILDAFLAAGGTLIDTGRIYGSSELVLGEWMQTRGVRDRVIVITKGGHGGEGALPASGLKELVATELTESLERLQTDRVDLYMLHRDNPDVPVEVIMDCLSSERSRGRICAYGVSNWTYDRVTVANAWARANGAPELAAVSNNISLAASAAPFYPGLVSVEATGQAWHVRTGTPLVAWSSQARGFFTGRYRPDMRDDVAATGDFFTKRMVEVYGSDANFERLRRATELGEREGGHSAVEIALAWVLHQPLPVIPIVGPHTVAELASCAGASSIALSAADVQHLDLRD